MFYLDLELSPQRHFEAYTLKVRVVNEEYIIEDTRGVSHLSSPTSTANLMASVKSSSLVLRFGCEEVRNFRCYCINVV